VLAPWQRERLPLIYLGESLAAVPGVGVDACFHAAPGHRGWMPVWAPD